MVLISDTVDKTGNNYISGTMTYTTEIPQANPRRARRNCLGRLRQHRKWQYRHFASKIFLFQAVRRCRNHWRHFYRVDHLIVVENAGFAIGILTVFVILCYFRLSVVGLLSLKSPRSILSGSQLKGNKFNVFLSKPLGAFYRKQNTCVKVEAEYER